MSCRFINCSPPREKFLAKGEKFEVEPEWNTRASNDGGALPDHVALGSLLSSMYVRRARLTLVREFLTNLRRFVATFTSAFTNARGLLTSRLAGEPLDDRGLRRHQPEFYARNVNVEAKLRS